MTRKQILEAITPLSHLNRWARTPYEHRRDMYSATSAIYAMKNRVIRAALDEGICSLRMVQVERPCKVCKGTGVYERIGYDGEPEYYDDCRRCNSTGKVTLRFAETAIESVKWHTPRPNSEALKLDPAMWEKCEATDWEPEQPGEEIGQPKLFSLLNEAERAVCDGKMIRYRFNGPFAYPLHFGTIEECFVCGRPAKNSWSYRPEIYRPGMRWNQGVCDACAPRAGRWPKQWPANLLRRNTMWSQDFPKWGSVAPLPPPADSDVVREWLERRGIAVGKIPPGEYAFEVETEVFFEVLAIRQGLALVRGADSRHPLCCYGESVVVEAGKLSGSIVRRIGGAF